MATRNGKSRATKPKLKLGTRAQVGVLALREWAAQRAAVEYIDKPSGHRFLGTLLDTSDSLDAFR